MAEDKKDVSFDAPWTDNLRHRPDPNRVTSRHTPSPGRFTPRPSSAGAALPADPATLHLGRSPATSAPRHDPQSTAAEPSYYDVPMLKRPVWKWPITSYFFLGGLSAGAYALGRAAHRAGGEKYRDLSRAASYLALATILPCPPLLIADLGDRKRFHHMLRVWKPSSPMNLGAWAITAFGGVATLEAAGQYLAQRKPPNRRARPGPSPNLFNGGAHLLLDVAGATSSIAVAGYTGVLLSCTANPLWCKNPFLGPLFSASAVSTGAEAVSLALDCTSRPGRQESPSHAILRKVDTLAHVAELGLMTGFLRFAGEKAKTLRSGPMSKYHHLSIGGILAAEVLKLLPAPRRLRRPLRMLASLLGLTAGFSMRWAMVFGGHDAAADPHTSRLVSRPQNSASRIGGRISDASGRVEHPTP